VNLTTTQWLVLGAVAVVAYMMGQQAAKEGTKKTPEAQEAGDWWTFAGSWAQ
jgi:hypothetical protein